MINFKFEECGKQLQSSNPKNFDEPNKLRHPHTIKTMKNPQLKDRTPKFETNYLKIINFKTREMWQNIANSNNGDKPNKLDKPILQS